MYLEWSAQSPRYNTLHHPGQQARALTLLLLRLQRGSRPVLTNLVTHSYLLPVVLAVRDVTAVLACHDSLLAARHQGYLTTNK